MLEPMSQIGKTMIVAGLGILAVGILIRALGKSTWIGHLPGDILVKKQNFTFYLPLTTAILLSLVLSVIAYFFFRK